MKPAILSAVLLPLAIASVIPREEKVDYSGYQALRVALPEDDAGFEELIGDLAAHVLHPGQGNQIEVVVDAETAETVRSLAPDAEVLVEDVGAAIAEEGELLDIAAVPGPEWFTAYQSYASHLSFLNELQVSLPSNTEIIRIGTSVQGRALTGIHIWGSGGRGSRPAILFHGTVHAREWISTKTTEYLAYRLVTTYSTDAAVRALVDRFDFYIIPVVNPDGYVYSQTTDRLWRKNRQTVSSSTCYGRDNNRNWNYRWEVTGGASTSPCSETYKGLAPADAPENQGMQSHVASLRASQGIRLYIDFHSYGQYVLWPYGYDCNLVGPHETAHQTLASRVVSGIRGVSGTAYTSGNSCRHLYATTGSAPDYLLGAGGSNYAYTIELRDRGTYGFVLPANQITPTVTETWAGVLAALQAI